MAFNKSSKNTSDVVFVNYDLDKSVKAAFKAELEKNPQHFMDLLEQAVSDGYSVTIKHDVYNDCEGCFIRHVENTRNKDMILTGRGKSAFSAMAGALFRHAVLFEGDWAQHSSKKGDVDDD